LLAVNPDLRILSTGRHARGHRGGARA